VRCRFVLILALLLCAAPAAAQKLESGPQVSKTIPGPFGVLDIATGKKTDFVEEFYNKPVVMIFSNTTGAKFAKLVTELDQRVGKERAAGTPLCAIVIVTREDEGLKKKLNDLRAREKIKYVVLAIEKPDGPPGWEVNTRAVVTAILYEHREVRANRAYKSRTFDDKAVSAILSDLPKILDP